MPVGVAHDLHFALKSYDAPVPREHAINRSERLAGHKHPGNFRAPTLFVFGMNVLIPAHRIVEPFFLRETERGFDLRADIRLAETFVEKSDKNDGGNLFDENFIDVGDARQIYFFAIGFCLLTD
jgi:hypothetical protein